MEQKRLSDRECQELFEKYKTPARVIRHCRAVSRVAVTIAEALNQAGFHFDISLVHSAGLIHDVCRTHPDHAKDGAVILRQLGYLNEAEIVGAHMRHILRHLKDMDELDMVCLADRLVKEDQYVGLDERIDYLIHKKGENPERTHLLLEGKKQIREIMDEVEEALGRTIDSLFYKT